MATASATDINDTENTDSKIRPDYLEQEWWTTMEAADYAKVSHGSIRNWIDADYFPHRSRYTRFRVHGRSFIRFIDTGKPQSMIDSNQSTS